MGGYGKFQASALSCAASTNAMPAVFTDRPVRFALRLAFAILLLLGIVSCDSGGSSQQEQPTFGNLEGKVTQSNTDSPVSGVTVTVATDKDSLSSTTGSDGSYSINRVPTGRHTLIANKSDFETFETKVVIDENETTTNNISVTPSVESTTLTGRVAREDTEEGIEGVKVTVADQEDFTDASGKYQVNNVPQGTKDITAEKKGFINFQGEVFLSSNNKEFNIEMSKGWLLPESIDSDTTIKGSTVYVKNNVTVSNSELRLRRGTEIKFESEKGLTVDKGKIVTQGTKSERVILSSDQENTTRSIWSTIKLVESEARMENTVIKNAEVALSAQSEFSSSSISFEKVLIKRNKVGIGKKLSREGSISSVKFVDNGTAINGDYGSLFAPSVSDSKFKRNDTAVYGVSELRNVVFSENELAIEDFSADIVECSFLENENVFGEAPSGSDGFMFATISKSEFIENERAVIFDDGNIYNQEGIESSNFVGNKSLAFELPEDAVYDFFSFSQIENNFIKNNNGKTGVDTTRDGSGGQYSLYDCGLECSKISNPRKSSVESAGSDWQLY